MRLGLIARMDRTGLGQGQTLRLAKLLKPDKIMLINSTPFNGNLQYPEWYSGFNANIVLGFPDDGDIEAFLAEVDIVITCETFYNNSFPKIAKRMGVKTICIANYEFFDWLKPSYRALFVPPDVVVTPSYWHLDELKDEFGAIYLPTPIFPGEFKAVRKANIKRTGKRKYLFMNGRTAVNDRNGLNSLYAALLLSKGDFTITIKSQSPLRQHPDTRLIYDYSNPVDQSKLYEDFDALIQPRRYGGQTLSMCEALLSGLPVIMTDIDPNNKVLPKEWLVPATKTGDFLTRLKIDIYSAEPAHLANRLDKMVIDTEAKQKAYFIGQQYEAQNLLADYKELLK